MAIKAVFCDIGNVLVRSSAHEIYRKYEGKYGISTEDLRSVFHFIHSGVTTKEQVVNYLRSKNLDVKTWDEFTKELYGSEKKNEDLYRLLEEAKENQNIKIIYTTNNGADVQNMLDKFFILGLPDLIIGSADIGVTKPSPEYWLKAFNLSKYLVSGLTYGQILVIDDSSENIDSASNFGFQTVHYRGNKSDEEIKTVLQSNEEIAENVSLKTPEEVKKFISGIN